MPFLKEAARKRPLSLLPPDLSELTIDEKVELYRQELEREKKVVEESQALPKNA